MVFHCNVIKRLYLYNLASCILAPLQVLSKAVALFLKGYKILLCNRYIHSKKFSYELVTKKYDSSLKLLSKEPYNINQIHFFQDSLQKRELLPIWYLKRKLESHKRSFNFLQQSPIFVEMKETFEQKSIHELMHRIGQNML